MFRRCTDVCDSYNQTQRQTQHVGNTPAELPLVEAECLLNFTFHSTELPHQLWPVIQWRSEMQNLHIHNFTQYEILRGKTTELYFMLRKMNFVSQMAKQLLIRVINWLKRLKEEA